jgi:hypothetical protein
MPQQPQHAQAATTSAASRELLPGLSCRALNSCMHGLASFGTSMDRRTSRVAEQLSLQAVPRGLSPPAANDALATLVLHATAKPWLCMHAACMLHACCMHARWTPGCFATVSSLLKLCVRCHSTAAHFFSSVAPSRPAGHNLANVVDASN